MPELTADREGMEFWKAEATPFFRLMAHGSSSGWAHTCCTLPSTTATTSGCLSSVLATMGPAGDRTNCEIHVRKDFHWKARLILEWRYLHVDLGLLACAYRGCHPPWYSWRRWPCRKGWSRWDQLVPSTRSPSRRCPRPWAGPWTCRSIGRRRSCRVGRPVWGIRWRGIRWSILARPLPRGLGTKGSMRLKDLIVRKVVKNISLEKISVSIDLLLYFFCVYGFMRTSLHGRHRIWNDMDCHHNIYIS